MMMLVAFALQPSRNAIVDIQHHQRTRDDPQYNYVFGI